MKERLTTVTRKGQITVPNEIRKALGIEVGDTVAVSLDDENGAPRAPVRPVRSVADMTFGVIAARKRPEDIKELRELAIEELADNAASEGLA